MKTKLTLASFAESTSIPATLVRAVIKQIGGWDAFQESAPDVANHGADGGFSGFIYYTDTVAFTRRNRAAIQRLTEQRADDFGMGAVDMVRGFNCLGKADYTESEVAQTLYGSGDGETNVANALAWYALEEVARAYVDEHER